MKKLLMMVLLWLGMAAPAQAWWNKDWSYRKPVTVDTSPSGVNISGAIGRTVVLVRLHSGDFTFTDALENGADLRIVDSDDKTPLPFHIEKYDGANGMATLWVSVPNLNGGEKRQLWLYFGNKNAPVTQDVAGTFDPDYTLAYHFSENLGTPVADKTANNNTAQNAPPGINDSGIIGRSGRFPGQGELTIAASPSLAMPAGAPLSFTAWVKPDQLAGEQALMTRGPLIVGINNGVPFVLVGAARTDGRAPLKQGDWSHVAMVADGKTIRLYVNGIESAAATAALPVLDGPITLGGAPGRPFTGELDEARLSKVARPAQMIMAMAQAEGASGKLVVVSDTAEKQSSGGGTFFFIITKVEAVDAFIIFLCLSLLAVASYVMITKGRYVTGAQRGNAAFLKRFRRMSVIEDFVSLRQRPEIGPVEAALIRKSPLANLFEAGIDELALRRKPGERRPLSGESIEALRAAVDAVQVEENQKLDRWMVLLTIAISGGPFIGLLGTVMGVMNTFGGVAMAGDVNVNAIAPGIAAALLATIAGLACAIPSLFGYNYLNSRISTLADDMRVFVDRLITRLAEMQHDEAPSPLPLAAE